MSLFSFCKGVVHLITIRNDPTMKENSAMLYREKRKQPFRSYTLWTTNTINNRIGNLNQEFRCRLPDNFSISSKDYFSIRVFVKCVTTKTLLYVLLMIIKDCRHLCQRIHVNSYLCQFILNKLVLYF